MAGFMSHGRVPTEDLTGTDDLLIKTKPEDHEYSEHDLKVIRSHFDAFDRDKNEVITVPEFETVLDRLDIQVPPDVSAREMLDFVDRDHDEMVSWSEFLQLVKTIRRMAKQEEDREEAAERKRLHDLSPQANAVAMREPSPRPVAVSVHEEAAKALSQSKSSRLLAGLGMREDEETMTDEEKAVLAEQKERERQRVYAIEQAADGPTRRYATRVVMLLFYLTYIDVGCMPVLADVFRRELELSESELGFLPLAYMLGFSIFTFVIAIISKRLSTYTWVVGFMLANGVATALTGTATNYTQLLMWRFITGVCNCVFGIFMFPLLYALEPHNPLVWSGGANAMIPLALGTGYIGTGVLIANGVAWESIFIGIGVAIFLNGLLLASGPDAFKAVVASSTFETTRTPSYKQKLRRLYCNGFNIMVAIIAGFFYIVMSAMQYWIVIFFIDVAKVDAEEAASVLGTLMLFSAFAGSLLGASVMNRVDGGVRATMLAMIFIALVTGSGFFVFWQSSNSGLLYGASTWLLMALAAHVSLVNDLPMKVLPPAYHDFGSSRLSLIQGLCGAAGPAIAGELVEEYSLPTMMACMMLGCGVIMVAGAVAFFVWPSAKQIRRKRDKIIKTWRGILYQLGKETHSMFAYDRVHHVNYKKFFRITEKHAKNFMHQSREDLRKSMADESSSPSSKKDQKVQDWAAEEEDVALTHVVVPLK